MTTPTEKPIVFDLDAIRREAQARRLASQRAEQAEQARLSLKDVTLALAVTLDALQRWTEKR